MSYNGFVVEITELKPHSNADRLQLTTVFGTQVVISLDYQIGDLCVYFPTDGKLGKEFAETNNLIRKKDAEGNEIGGYLDPDKRHIRSIRLRGEFSDGLLLPISSLEEFVNIEKLEVGDIVKDYNGITICEKYVPYQRPNKQQGVNQEKKRKSDFIQFAEHKSTKQLAYSLGEFKEGDLCYITHKLHGTSGRTTHTIQEKELPLKWYEKLFKREPKIEREYAVATGTRRVVLDFTNEEAGYYGDNSFRKKYHDQLAPRLKKGETIYYEIVGYVKEGMPIMPTCDNRKINDKEFVKRYGEKTTFTYGCQDGESDIFAYRMTLTTEEGYVIEYPQNLLEIRCEQMGIKFAPVLDKFIYTTEEDLLERIEKYELAPDIIDPSHINEGVIVRVENGEELKAYKFKNIYFKILEGIAKAEALEPDMEEAEYI